MNYQALIFSGYNQRAVIALCRFFRIARIKFSIVASGVNDPIYKTDYKESVIYKRPDKNLDIKLFGEISKKSKDKLVYCPTSEYLNQYVLSNTEVLKDIGISCGLPPKKSYLKITNKGSSQKLFMTSKRISTINSYDRSQPKAPCVIKPIHNVYRNETLYPIICFTEDEVKNVLEKIDINNYFIQPYILGQSYYLCGYLSKNGNYDYFWQENLLQQANGKSIVFSMSSKNIGIVEDEFFDILAQNDYFGPIMAEFIKADDSVYFVEINPRFWGPLQLLIDYQPSILNGYINDWFPDNEFRYIKDEHPPVCFYAWYKGANEPNLHRYPAFRALNNSAELIKKYDIYNRQDTEALHMLQ